MNNDYSFINSSDTSQQLALLDEFLSENYEFRHNVLSDVYEIRELPRPLLIDEAQNFERNFVNASGNIFRYYRGEREQIEDGPKGAILDLL